MTNQSVIVIKYAFTILVKIVFVGILVKVYLAKCSSKTYNCSSSQMMHSKKSSPGLLGKVNDVIVAWNHQVRMPSIQSPKVLSNKMPVKKILFCGWRHDMEDMITVSYFHT